MDDLNTLDQGLGPDASPGIESETDLDKGPGATDTPPQDQTEETDEQKNARLAEEARVKAAERAARRQQSINQRFAEITAEKKAAEKMAQDLLQLVQQQGQPVQTQDTGEPQRDKFDSYEEYLVAKTAWTATQTTQRMLEQAAQKQNQERSAEQAAEAERKATQDYAARYAKAVKDIPDFAETMADADVQVPNGVAKMIKLLDNGPIVAYHLQKNPGLAARFATAPAELHGVILGEISSSLKTTTQLSNAPPPGKPGGVTSKPAATSEDPPEDPAAYMKWAKKHLK